MNLEELVSIIINRNAGNGNEEFAAYAEELSPNYPAYVHSTQTATGMGKRLQTDLENGLKLVVICGGDGTLMSAANFMLEYCSRTGRAMPQIAYIPRGTGNLLKSLIGIEGIENPLKLLLDSFEKSKSDDLPTLSFPQVKTTFTNANTGKEKVLLYSMTGSGMDAALLQDFERVCRGRYGPLSNGVPGYVRTVVGRTIPRELYSLVKPKFNKVFANAQVRITSDGVIQKVIETTHGEELYGRVKVLYDGPLSELHTVLVGTTVPAGFGITAFPHLDIKSQHAPLNPMQVRVLHGPKWKVVGHLLNQAPNITGIPWGNYRSSPYFDDYLVGEGGKVIIKYDLATALQIGGDFVAEASSIKYEREGELKIVDWSKLAALQLEPILKKSN